MSSDIKRLKQLAEAVPKDRKLITEEWIYTLEDSGYFSCDEYNPQIAAFLEAANPEAVLGLIARIEKLEASLQFYADHNNWMVTRKDDLHEAKRTIVGDVDSYGYQRDEYSPNILQIIGGKTAREALKEET